jgi:hypothetical protein
MPCVVVRWCENLAVTSSAGAGAGAGAGAVAGGVFPLHVMQDVQGSGSVAVFASSALKMEATGFFETLVPI